jgi:AraC-like DNA-binding protein
MDVSEANRDAIEPEVENAVVVWANHHQFAAGDDTRNVVMNRALVWCIAGRGEIDSRNQTFVISAGSLLVLPWLHDIRYRPDPSDPFLLGTVHLIPHHDRGVRVIPSPFYVGYASPVTPHRRDVAWPGFDDPTLITGGSAAAIIRLGEVAIEQLPQYDDNPAAMRALGVLLARAVTGIAMESDAGNRLPATLIHMQEYARAHLHAGLTTRALANVVPCSVSTAERQFRRYTGLSPMNWMKEERLQVAARLLRTTNRRVGEVSAIAGFRDSFYFARAFRARFGASPRNFSRRYSAPAADAADRDE